MSHDVRPLSSAASLHAHRHAAQDDQGGGARIHVVRGKDEDLQTLAARYGVQPQRILAENRHLILDPSRPLVQGDRLQIPAADPGVVHADAGIRGAHASTAVAGGSHYRETLTLARHGHAPPAQSATLEGIVDDLNGYMRPHHSSLGNRNRIVHVRGPDAGEEIRFPARTGIRMVDGNGEFRGTLAESSVKLNYGQRKVITYTFADGHTETSTYVYAFATKIKSAGGGEMGASGWIPLAGLKDSTAKRAYAGDIAANVKHGPVGGDAPGAYTITGGNTSDYGALKVNPGHDGEGVSRDKSLKATDYLHRPGGVVNLLYSLPGHGGAATDTLRTGAEFIRSAGVPTVKIPLYLPKDPTTAERAAWRDGSAPHYMEFVYGRVGDRHGWIAADALTAKAA